MAKRKREIPPGAARIPSDVLGARLTEIRTRQNLTAADVAARCAAVGMPELTAQTIYNLETGRPGEDGRRKRLIAIDELLALAYVLDVAPVNLLLPVRPDQRARTLGSTYRVVPKPRTLGEPGTGESGEFDTGEVRKWITGQQPLPGIDMRTYFTEVPEEEFRQRFGHGSNAAPPEKAGDDDAGR